MLYKTKLYLNPTFDEHSGDVATYSRVIRVAIPLDDVSSVQERCLRESGEPVVCVYYYAFEDDATTPLCYVLQDNFDRVLAAIEYKTTSLSLAHLFLN